jgi:hypothetical protein
LLPIVETYGRTEFSTQNMCSRFDDTGNPLDEVHIVSRLNFSKAQSFAFSNITAKTIRVGGVLTDKMDGGASYHWWSAYKLDALKATVEQVLFDPGTSYTAPSGGYNRGILGAGRNLKRVEFHGAFPGGIHDNYYNRWELVGSNLESTFKLVCDFDATGYPMSFGLKENALAYFPTRILVDYMTATGWSGLAPKMVGYVDDPAEFPTFSGYAATWYSDEDCAIAISEPVAGRNYCRLTAVEE